MIVDIVDRLEADSRLTDLARGFRAETADPVWFLGRQWQLGEHQGEDASSPTGVRYRARLTPIDPIAGQPGLDPRRVPAEAIVESEPGDFWTAGRRIRDRPGRRRRGGRAGCTAARRAGGCGWPTSPRPTTSLDGTGPDGRACWLARAALGAARRVVRSAHQRPPADEPVDLWDPAEFGYTTTFTAGDTALTLVRHDGGDLDWHSVDATHLSARRQLRLTPVAVYPSRLLYPGAPLPRWWQIEDGHVDIGGYPPDRSHFATLLLIDLITNHSDDWFRFPVNAARRARRDTRRGGGHRLVR